MDIKVGVPKSALCRGPYSLPRCASRTSPQVLLFLVAAKISRAKRRGTTGAPSRLRTSRSSCCKWSSCTPNSPSRCPQTRLCSTPRTALRARASAGRRPYTASVTLGTGPTRASRRVCRSGARLRRATAARATTSSASCRRSHSSRPRRRSTTNGCSRCASARILRRCCPTR
jgi:hypothetical protein